VSLSTSSVVFVVLLDGVDEVVVVPRCGVDVAGEVYPTTMVFGANAAVVGAAGETVAVTRAASAPAASAAAAEALLVEVVVAVMIPAVNAAANAAAAACARGGDTIGTDGTGGTGLAIAGGGMTGASAGGAGIAGGSAGTAGGAAGGNAGKAGGSAGTAGGAAGGTGAARGNATAGGAVFAGGAKLAGGAGGNAFGATCVGVAGSGLAGALAFRKCAIAFVRAGSATVGAMSSNNGRSVSPPVPPDLLIVSTTWRAVSSCLLCAFLRLATVGASTAFKAAFCVFQASCLRISNLHVL